MTCEDTSRPTQSTLSVPTDVSLSPFSFAFTLQQISELALISKKDRARQAIKSSSPPTHRSRILDLLAPFFQLHTSKPAERTPLRTTLVHLLLPHLDAERRYDLKERRLATKLALELGLNASVLESWDHEAAWGGQYAEREVPVCLGEVVGREWEKKRDLVRCPSSLVVWPPVYPFRSDEFLRSFFSYFLTNFPEIQ